MKKLLIALIAFALTLGVACKKENVEVVKEKEKVEIVKKSDVTPETVIQFDYDHNTFPHSTGACLCAGCIAYGNQTIGHRPDCPRVFSNGMACLGCRPPR